MLSRRDSKPPLQQQTGQNQQADADDRAMHILLEAEPALPGAASETEDSLERRDTALNAGPKPEQLPVNPTGAHHLIDLQLAILGHGDVSDALRLGPLQIAAAGKTPISTDLLRPTAVQIVLALDARLKLISIYEVSPHHLSIQHQAGDATGQK